jgi:hypothetical protein
MILLSRGFVQVMGGLLIYGTCLVESRPTISLTRKRRACAQLMLTLAFLTTEGIQHIWQISLDSTGKLTDVYLM